MSDNDQLIKDILELANTANEETISRIQLENHPRGETDMATHNLIQEGYLSGLGPFFYYGLPYYHNVSLTTKGESKLAEMI